MKVSLGCCYQCDVPPDNIKNLRIFCGRISYTAHTKSVVFAHLKKCATTTRNFFVFFLGGPTQLGVRLQAGGPARYNLNRKLSRKLFLLLSCIWDIMGYIKVGPWQVNTC